MLTGNNLKKLLYLNKQNDIIFYYSEEVRSLNTFVADML